MSSEHPINSSNWHEAYPAPDDETMSQLRQVTAREAGKKMQDDADGFYDSEVTTDEEEEYKEEGRKPRRVFIVDVRRADCESMIPGAINLPAQTFQVTLPTLLPFLAKERLVLFHCSSSRGRGPRVAGWYADALTEHLEAEIEIARRRNWRREERILEAKLDAIDWRVGVLVGGIKAWEQEFGARPIEERGKKHDVKKANGRLDLRTIPL